MPGMFGGDGSVKWFVRANRVKSATARSEGIIHTHEGVDDSSGSFIVTINWPTDEDARKVFIAEVRKYAASPTDQLKLTLPIEDTVYLREHARRLRNGQEDLIKGGNEEQIRIDWPQ